GGRRFPGRAGTCDRARARPPRSGAAGEAALVGAQQGRPDVRGRSAGSGRSGGRRARLDRPLVPGVGDLARRHLADHARRAGVLRPAARGAGGSRCRSGCARRTVVPAATKNPAWAGFFACGACLVAQAATQAACSALMRAVRRLLWRAALLRWIRPRALKRSRMGWATSNAALAPAASLASIALSTFLTAVRSIERWAALRALRTTACLARFLDDLMLATGNPGNLLC